MEQIDLMSQRGWYYADKGECWTLVVVRPVLVSTI